MNGHLGLNFEASRKHRIGFDEREREGTVAGHDVGDVRMEQAIDGTTYQTVTEVVEWPFVLLEVGGAQAVADHHVVAFEHLIHHGRRCVCRIGVIAICHDVHVGIDVFEHGANHVALALARFLADDCARGCGNLGGAISGIIVVNVDVCLWQRRFEIANNLADSHFLIIARKQHGDGGRLVFWHKHHYTLLLWITVVFRLAGVSDDSVERRMM